MHLSRNDPFSDKTTLHLELPGTENTQCERGIATPVSSRDRVGYFGRVTKGLGPPLCALCFCVRASLLSLVRASGLLVLKHRLGKDRERSWESELELIAHGSESW